MRTLPSLFFALAASGAAQAQMACVNNSCTFSAPLNVTDTFKVGGKTVTLGGNLTMIGAYSFTGTLTGATTLTFPTTGTVTALGNTTTGTGSTLVLSAGPTLTNSAGNPAATFVSDQSTPGGAQQILVRGSSNSNQQLLVGYNTSSDYANIQAILQGTSYKPTFISPTGGGAGVGVTALVGSDLFTVGGIIGATGGFRSGTSGGVALAMSGSSSIRDTTNGASILYQDVSAGGATDGSFAWRSSNAFTVFANLSANGFDVKVGDFLANGVAGFSGSKTAGSCVLTISKGIITNVTGC